MATGFFDLNIPYEPPSTSSAKPNTAKKLAVRAMEMGFTGIAYNRSIGTTISSNDHCSIPLFSPSSFLAFHPSLPSCINFRRDLLSVPRSSPFRQYTRLTFSFDNLSQASLVTGKNDVVSSYDIFAIQPSTQDTFDYACETAQVDIISIDCLMKLPFRIKSQKVKAAIKRGIYFEVSYSGLVTTKLATSIRALTNIKFLVHWTKGKNLIISSAAPSLNEFRGPYDVANLLSLTGISMEQAKGAISRNCRNLLTHALRKKHFYKETIRAEPLSSNAKSDMKGSLAFDLSTWDPISSGEGDLHLDNVAQYFSDTTTASKTVKAIDFSSLVDNEHSSGEIFLVGIKPNEVPVATATTEKPGSDVVLEVRNAVLDDKQMVLDVQDREDRSVAECGESSRKSEDNTVILSDHVPFHIMGDDVKAGPSLFSAFKNYEEEMQEHQETASESGLHPDDHHSPLLATTDDIKVAVANCETLNAVDMQEQDVGSEKVFVREDDLIAEDNSSVSMDVCVEQVKEEEDRRDVNIESILVLDDDWKVKTNTSVQPGKAKRKRKKHKPVLSPSETLEEHKDEDADINGMPILNDCSNVEDKDNSLCPSVPGKTRRKRKKHHQALILPSKPLEEHRHEGKAKAKRRRHHKKSLSPSKHVEEEQPGKVDAESVLVPGGDSNAKDISSTPNSSGVSLFPVGVKPNEKPVVSGVTEKPGGHNLVLGIDQTTAMDVDSSSASVAKLNNFSVSDTQTDILSKNINLLPPNIKMPIVSDVLKLQSTIMDGERMPLDIKDREGRTATENIMGTNHEQAIEQEHGDTASEHGLRPDDHHIPLMATSDDKKVPITNCKTLSMMAVEEQAQVVDTEKVFVREDDSITKYNSSVSSGVCIKEGKEEQELRDFGPEGISIPDDLKVKVNTPVPLGKARSKREKHKPLVSPSNPVEEHQNEDMGSNSIPILDDNSNDKDKNNTSVLSSPGKARRKRKSHHKPLLSSPKPLEEHGHEDVVANNIPILDYDSNVEAKDNSSFFFSPEKARKKRMKHRQLLLTSSMPLEEHNKHEDVDINNPPLLDDDQSVKDKDNYPASPSPGNAKVKQRRHRKKGFSSSKNLEERHGEIGAESIPGPVGDS